MLVLLGCLTAIVCAYGLYLRLYDPLCDDHFEKLYGLSSSNFDALFLHSARAWLLNGSHLAEDWLHAYIIAPLPNALMYGIAKFFGSGSIVARMTCSLSAGLAVAILIVIALRYSDLPTTLMTSCFAGLNIGFIAHFRQTHIESFLLLNQALVYALVLFSWRRPQASFWVGWSLVMGLAVKASSILFSIPCAILAFLWMNAEPTPEIRKYARRRFLWGIASASAAYAIFIAINGHRWARFFLGYSATRTLIKNGDRWGSFVGIPAGSSDYTYGLFTLMPYLCLALLIAFYVLTSRFENLDLFPRLRIVWNREERISYGDRLTNYIQKATRPEILDLAFYILFCAGLLIHLLLNVDADTRRLTHLVLPMTLLAARGLRHWLSTEPLHSTKPWGFLSLSLSLLVGWLTTKAMLFAFLGVSDHPIPIFPHVYPNVFDSLSRTRFIRSGVFELIYFPTALLGIALVKNLTSLAKPWRLCAVMLLVLGAVCNDLQLYWHGMKSKTYFGPEVGRTISSLCGSSPCYVLGYLAVATEWEGTHYGLMYYPGTGIGYKASTIPQLANIIKERSIRYLLVLDRSGAEQKPGSSYDWEHAELTNITLEEFKKQSPVILTFNKVVYSAPLFLNYPETDGGRLVILQRS